MVYLGSDGATNSEMTQMAKAYIKGEDKGPSAEDREKYPILSMLEQLDAQITEQLNLPKPLPEI